MTRATTVLGVCAALVAVIAAAASPAAAAVLPGVPAEDSLLFALDSRSGTLVRDGKTGKTSYVLTLSGVDRRATWFADRPRRDAGHVSARRLFGSWRRLGFSESPPNAALVISGASRNRDTLAFELELRSYKAGKRRARFGARRLGSVGNGLAHLNRRLDRRGPLRFASSSLFIDNTSAAEGCSLGQPQLMASSIQQATDMIPADGRLLPIVGNYALFAIYGTAYGGDGKTTFGVPKLSAPAGMDWFICVSGYFPTLNTLGQSCSLGEVDYWALPRFAPASISDPKWLPADGRSLPVGQYFEYASAYGAGPTSIQLPNVPAPPGLISLACVNGDGYTYPSLAQVDLYPGQPPAYLGDWLPTDGRQLSVEQNQALYAIFGNSFGSAGTGTFAIPTLGSPAPGVGYYVSIAGYWPFD